MKLKQIIVSRFVSVLSKKYALNVLEEKYAASLLSNKNADAKHWRFDYLILNQANTHIALSPDPSGMGHRLPVLSIHTDEPPKEIIGIDAQLETSPEGEEVMQYYLTVLLGHTEGAAYGNDGIKWYAIADLGLLRVDKKIPYLLERIAA